MRSHGYHLLGDFVPGDLVRPTCRLNLTVHEGLPSSDENPMVCSFSRDDVGLVLALGKRELLVLCRDGFWWQLPNNFLREDDE